MAGRAVQRNEREKRVHGAAALNARMNSVPVCYSAFCDATVISALLQCTLRCYSDLCVATVHSAMLQWSLRCYSVLCDATVISALLQCTLRLYSDLCAAAVHSAKRYSDFWRTQQLPRVNSIPARLQCPCGDIACSLVLEFLDRLHHVCLNGLKDACLDASEIRFNADHKAICQVQL
jgi:hypothetical protein